jgi:hypothetical protein
MPKCPTCNRTAEVALASTYQAPRSHRPYDDGDCPACGGAEAWEVGCGQPWHDTH